MVGDDLRFARMIARRTWRFFETFVGAEDNWLPPDNFQEDPNPVVAHRTSPTNIGLLFLSTLSAHDFGYISTLEFVERQELTFARLPSWESFAVIFSTGTTPELLSRYCRSTFRPSIAAILPAISSPLKQACIEMPDVRLLDKRVVEGLSDTINAISEEAGRVATSRQRTDVVTVRQLRTEIEACKELTLSVSDGPLWSWFLLLDSLEKRVCCDCRYCGGAFTGTW